METRFDWGNIDVYVVVRGGLITGAKVYSDCLVPDIIDAVNDELNSKHYTYSSEGIDDLAKTLEFKFEGLEANLKIVSDIKNWLIKVL
jgi:Bacterial lipoate protein ligase C-terminus